MRYTTIIDITDMASYKSVNARLLYMHLVLKRAHQTTATTVENEVITSYRRLADEVGLTLSALRYALETLELDGLISVTQSAPQTETQTAPQTATRRRSRLTAQPTTHIRVMTYSDLQGGSDTASDMPSDTPTSTENSTNNITTTDTASDTVTNNYKNKIQDNKPLTHTHDDEAFFIEMKLDDIAQAVGKTTEETAYLIQQFIKTCEVTSTIHKTLTDAAAHCISWINKQPVRKRTQKPDRKSDAQIREEQKELNQMNANAEKIQRENSVKKLSSRIPTPSNMSASDLARMALIVKEKGMIKAEQHFGPPAWQMFSDACKSINISKQTLIEMI